MNNKTSLIQPEQIEQVILLIRGHRVLLDRDLAALYGVTTGNLNKAVAAGSLRHMEKQRYGQRVVDYFSHQARNPYNNAETLDDIRDGLHVVRTLLQMGRQKQAYDTFCDGLSNALQINLEAHAEILSLLRPFFSRG